MAIYRKFALLAVVIVALLGNALITQKSLAQSSSPIFPLSGNPSDYIKGTKENGWKGYHCDGGSIICGWDYWRPDKTAATVLASIDGIVLRCGELDDFGNPVVVIQNSDWQVGYLHMERVDITCNQNVSAGQVIGLTGNIGYSDWNHLHFWAKNLVTGQFDESQNWPETGSQVVQVSQQTQTGFQLETQDLSHIPLPIIVGGILALVFALGLLNRNTRGVAALSLLVILVAGFAWLVFHTNLEKAMADFNLPKVSVAQSAPSTSGSISPVFTPEVQHWGNDIVRWSAQYQLDPNLAATVMQIESCGYAGATSTSNAQGLFQVMPFHFDPGENMQDPDTNASRGLAYLAAGLQKGSGNAGLALAGYNGGHSKITQDSSQWSFETQRYYYWGTGIYQDAISGAAESPRLQEWLNAGGASLCAKADSSLGLQP